MSFRTVSTAPNTHRATRHLNCLWGVQGLIVSTGPIVIKASAGALVVGKDYALQLGEGDDAGKARIVLDKDGRRLGKLGKDGGRLVFGSIAEIDPGAPQRKQACAWRRVDDIIEFDLPDWTCKSKPAVAERKSLPAPAKVSAPPAAAVPPVAAPEKKANGVAADRREVIKGVTVSFAADDGFSSISYGNKRVNVASAEAKLATRLLSGAPNPVGRAFLCKALCPGIRADDANIMLDKDARGLKPALEAIGLTLNVVKGVGFAIGGLK